MKAAAAVDAEKVLRLYKAGEREFKEVSLCGQSFKGENLSGADFSSADIRSANFTDANLTGVKFFKAKAGLQTGQAAGLVIVSLILLAFSGVLSAFASAVVELLWNSIALNSQIAGGLSLSIVFLFLSANLGCLISLLLILVFVYFAGLGFTLFLSLVLPLCIVFLFSTVFNRASVLYCAVAIIAVVAIIVADNKFFDEVVVSALAGTLATALAAVTIGTLATALAAVTIGTSAAALAAVTIGTSAAALAAVTIGTSAAALAAVTIGTSAATVILVSTYVGCRTLNDDEHNTWIHSVAIAFAAIGGTSFRGAILTDADFSQAKLNNSDLRGATLIRTRWRDAEKLERVRPGKTYLSNYKIQQLLLTGYGKSQPFTCCPHLEGVDLQYSNLMAADFTGATLVDSTLRGANLADAVLTKTNLDHVNLQKADLSRTKLYQARFEQIDLRGAKLQGAKLQGVNLRGFDLANVDLRDADLREADLREANLSGSNLSRANLSAVRALGTSFEKATFTGACLKDLNVNSSTNLKNVVCDYIYLEDDHQERRPHGGCFQEGEFTQRFQQVLETVDLFFDDGVDWKAFLGSFQDLQSEYGAENLAVQGIERKGQSSFEIRLAVPSELDKAEIEKIAYARYEIRIKQVEAQYREQLAAKDGKIVRYRQQSESLKDELLDAYRQQSRQSAPDLMEVVKILAARDSIVNVEATAVADNQSSKYDLSKAQFAGGFAETVQGNQIGGTINNAAAETLPLAEAAAEIKDLLKQLEASNPSATEAEQTAFLNVMIPPTRRERFVGALRAAGGAAIEEVPYGAVLKALVEGWQSPNG